MSEIMERNGGIAVVLSLLLIVLMVLLILFMLMTLMLFFHIYKVVKNNLNLKEGEDEVVAAKTENPSLKKDEKKIENPNTMKEEAKIDDKIKKKEEAFDCYRKCPTINVYINLSQIDDRGKVITTVEGIEKENNQENSKSTIYSCVSMKNNNIKNDLKKKAEDNTKKNDINLSPDSLQSQNNDKKSEKNGSKRTEPSETKNNVNQTTRLQNCDLEKQSTSYVSRNYYLDNSNLDKINKDITEKGYGKWLNNEWERIGTGDKKHELGDEKVILQRGDGNIRITKSNNGIYYVGVPAKERWKGYDFDAGAFKECYEVINPVEDNIDYKIARIDRLASLYIIDGNEFQVHTRGKVQVDPISQ